MSYPSKLWIRLFVVWYNVSGMKINKKTYLLLVLIIFLALFLRVWNINNTPPGVYPDEAVNGIDAMNALHYGQWHWFYEANNGREGLMMNLIAFSFNFFGVTVFALKLPNIIFGTLTVLGMFLLGREMFSSTRVGLISAFLVATAFWSLNFSRMAFRANLLPFVLAFSFYFLWKGIRTRSYWDFVWGGAFFGLGLHTYIAFRIAPLILVVALFTFIVNRRGFLKDYWKHILVFVVFTTIVAAPMLYTFYKHPEYLGSRTSEISVLNPDVNHGHLIAALAKTIGLSIIKYSIWGDQNWRQNFPPYAILDPIAGIAFIFGFCYIVLKFIHLWSVRIYKGERHHRLETYTFLLAWLFIMCVPEFMAYEGNPHALRSIGTLPVAFIISALTFEYFFRKSYSYTPLFKKVTTAILVLIIVVIGVFNSIKYLVVWAGKPEAAAAFERTDMDIANRVKAAPADKEEDIVIEVMQRVPVQLFNWERPNTNYYYPGEIDQINPQTNNFEIIILDDDPDVINSLEARFPNLTYEDEKDSYGSIYHVLK